MEELRAAHCSLASASARDTRVDASALRYSLLPCPSAGGSICAAASSPAARQVSAVAGCPASARGSTAKGRGATVLPGSDLVLAAAPLLVAVVTRASLTVWVGVALSSRLRITRRAGRTEVATTTLPPPRTGTT